jgi:hypothetical protein
MNADKQYSILDQKESGASLKEGDEKRKAEEKAV